MTDTETDVKAARALGVTSLAIAAAELFAPKYLQRTMGIGNHTGTLRVLGVREALAGVDLLTHEDPTPGLWSRVAGDAVDLALLGVAATKTKRPGGLLGAALMVLGITALDVFFAQKLQRET